MLELAAYQRCGTTVEALEHGYGANPRARGQDHSGAQPESPPLQWIAAPEEYAVFYILPVSDAGRASTGSVFPVSGGSAVLGPAFKGWET